MYQTGKSNIYSDFKLVTSVVFHVTLHESQVHNLLCTPPLLAFYWMTQGYN